MKIHGNIPIDDGKPNERLREAQKHRDLDHKDNAGKVEDSKDKISLSGKAKEINDIKKLISDLPDIRSDRVDALKKAIDSGNYTIDAQKIAQRILEEL